MRPLILWIASLTLGVPALPLLAAQAQTKDEAAKLDPAKPQEFKPEQQATKGSVTIGGTQINYDAYAGTLVVHPRDWDDVPQNKDPNDKSLPPEASMFYVAYFKSDAKGAPRPVTFFYNGGPGSSTVWLHMGAFGPKRVVTADDSHTPAAPYAVVNNDFSLLDATDLVFIDAPGTGFSRISGKDREKAFYGIDQDAEAFADFIVQFLSKYSRWNSPKYMFGESYGTTRSAVLSNILETERSTDFNGVILLSQILNFDFSADAPHQCRRIRKESAGRRQHDHRPARRALLRPHDRSAQQGSGLRSAIRSHQLSLRGRIQRLRSQRFEIRGEPRVQAGNRPLAIVERPAQSPRRASRIAASRKRDG
jgi:hypothetical protein